MDKIKILIVDDHPMMRDALKMAFETEHDLQVIGEASDPTEAFKLLKKLKPDVIIMDLLMPNMNGVDAIEQIVSENPHAKVLVLTSMEDEERILASIQAGALGYFPKTAPRQYLLEAIRKVSNGLPYMPVGITLKLFKGLRHSKITANPQITVTARQREIMILLAEGKTDHEIGKTLHLQESTVRAHIHHIQQRLGMENRFQVAAYVHKNIKNTDSENTSTF